MPSKKGIDQALTWLKSKTHDKNTLDSINAELCINVITDLQRQVDRLGALFNNTRNSRYYNKPQNAPTAAKQLTFMEKEMGIPRTENIPLNRKGDVTHEKNRTEVTGVCDRQSDR